VKRFDFKCACSTRKATLHERQTPALLSRLPPCFVVTHQGVLRVCVVQRYQNAASGNLIYYGCFSKMMKNHQAWLVFSGSLLTLSVRDKVSISHMNALRVNLPPATVHCFKHNPEPGELYRCLPLVNTLGFCVCVCFFFF